MKMPLLTRYRSGSLLAALGAASLAGCLSVGVDPYDMYDYEPIVVSSVPPPPVSGGTLMVTKDGTTGGTARGTLRTVSAACTARR